MFIKAAAILLLLYAIVTATPADQYAMYQGVSAVARSITAACTRDGSLCTSAFVALKDMRLPASGQLQPTPESDRRPLDGSARVTAP